MSAFIKRSHKKPKETCSHPLALTQPISKPQHKKTSTTVLILPVSLINSTAEFSGQRSQLEDHPYDFGEH